MKQAKQTSAKNAAGDIIFLMVVFGLCAAAVFTAGCQPVVPGNATVEVKTFESGDQIIAALKQAQTSQNTYSGGMLKGLGGRVMMAEQATGTADMAVTGTTATTAAPTASGDESGTPAFSETNVQVKGVDEADIVKTDGKYIYYIPSSQYGGASKIYIAKSYPADDAEILSTINLADGTSIKSDGDSETFTPQEMFIDGDKLLVFGYSNINFPMPLLEENTDVNTNENSGSSASPAVAEKMIAAPGRYGGYYGYRQTTSVKIFDVSDRKNPEEIKKYDFEGDYISSRKIGKDVYFVMRSSLNYQILENWDSYTAEQKAKCPIAPQYRETDDNGEEVYEPVAKCVDISYIPPIPAQQFITVVSLSIDADRDIEKEVILGSGSEIYASTESLYVVSPLYQRYYGGNTDDDGSSSRTVINRFSLDNGKITHEATGDVPGQILNQFSMDEYDRNFRIATTKSGYINTPTGGKDTSTNNMYVLDKDLKMLGKVEEIAPGESIYSVRFMGKRAYMVTFKHVDPLFVIDLSDPANPKVLGKLKIPGFSDYLHPYDETHLIGIGKEVDESIDADKVHTEGAVYYTAIQGVKLAIFDVSDVENPKEMYKEVIGDRGSDSLASREHKAFLFDKEKELLVVPMTVAELKEGQDKSQEGEFNFQGAYVYNINLEDGFKLKGRISHIDDPSVYEKAGSYMGNWETQIVRSLYIDNDLWTFSSSRMQANSLDDLKTVSKLVLESGISVDNEQPNYMKV